MGSHMNDMRQRSLNSCRSQRRKSKWALDYDYLQQLSEIEAEFLAEFSNYYYHGSPHRCGKHIEIDDAARKESYTRNNHAGYDVFNKMDMVELKNIEVASYVMIEDIIIQIIDKKA